MALTDNLVGYWKLDDSGDDEISTNDLTLTNGSYVTGKINNGADFTGASNSYATFTTKLSTVWDSAYTITMWVNAATLDTTNGNVLLWPGDRNQQHIINNIEKKLEITTYDGTAASTVGTTVFSTGTWYFIAFQRISGTEGKVWVNGADDTSTTKAMRNPAGTLTQDFRLASRQDATAANFDGIIDEVGIWSRALSSTEISTLYNSGNGLAYPFSSSAIKTINGLSRSSVKTVGGLAIASLKSFNGLQ
jgi:hypothetical protein